VDGADNAWPSDSDKAQDLACGPVSLTPRGGRHHIFRQPKGKDWKNTASKTAPKVDTRANGGYIVLPPSVVDGKPYSWAATLELDAAPEQLPEPPDWVAAQLDGPGEVGDKPFYREPRWDEEETVAVSEPTNAWARASERVGVR